MKKILAIVLLLWASVAYAQFNGCPSGFCPNGIAGFGFGPPSGGGSLVCSNSLDFSDGCNSQYLL